MPLVWRDGDSNPRPSALEVDALQLELLGPVDRYGWVGRSVGRYWRVVVSLKYYRASASNIQTYPAI